ncbi:hypothetical protein KBC03_02915 [Patescibacteria group bacterium]|nr:hypothetical protein [Patescibacteria group bacterium]
MKKQIKLLIPLHIILKECEITLHGITYDNIHRLGDANIEALIAAIRKSMAEKSTLLLDSPFDNAKASTVAMREEKAAHKIYSATAKRAYKSFFKTHSKQRNAVIRFLESQMTGVYLPVLPYLRSRDENAYKKYTHMVIYPYNLHLDTEYDFMWITPPRWESAMYMGGTVNKYYCFLSPIVHSDNHDYQAGGYAWELNYRHPLVMPVRDLEILRVHIEKNDIWFVDIWCKNNMLHSRSSERIKELLMDNPPALVPGIVSHTEFLKRKKEVKQKIAEMAKDKDKADSMTIYFTKKKLDE